MNNLAVDFESSQHAFEAYFRTADMCKNCAICGKGFKIGTNEAFNIKIKIWLGDISKIFRQRHFTEEEILEKVFT